VIRVRVELLSARTGDVTELARMHICNVGGTMQLRDYDGETFLGRSTESLNRLAVNRRGAVRGWPSERLHVWFLVAKMLTSMGYLR
jgi:hypothetical protein